MRAGKAAFLRDTCGQLRVDRSPARHGDRAGRPFALADLLVGDLILCEVLQGLRNDTEAKFVEEALREFEIVSLVDPELAVKAASNYRFLRTRGYTVRRTIDLIIGTFCIERGHSLLHGDRDFTPMKRFLGLQTV